jgi:hypothetical protein
MTKISSLLLLLLLFIFLFLKKRLVGHQTHDGVTHDLCLVTERLTQDYKVTQPWVFF